VDPPETDSTPRRPAMIGLTGAIAAGKSEALAALDRLGAATISSDAVVHGLLGSPEVQGRLVDRWGGEIATEGTLDRERVGAIVFADPAELAWLEAELHPLVAARIAEWAGSLPADREVAVVEVPLLFETGMEDGFDATLAIVSDDALREARAGARGTALVGEREGRQLAQDEKAARATYVVANDGEIADLERKLAKLLPELASLRPEAR
jgi:dephospho-CoA kinase